MIGRKEPYTVEGIKRLGCVRCGKQAYSTWQACADKRMHRPLCKKCDIALNALVLRWMGFDDWQEKIAEYKKGL